MSAQYAISSETRGTVEIFTLRQGEITAAVAPAWGNNCFLFQAQEPVLEAVPFDEYAKRPTSYGIPILFPFPNRLRDGGFTLQGQRYPIDPPRHGFVRDKPWQILDKGASDTAGAWLTARVDASRYAEQILRQFPFPFQLQVTYRLRENTLFMETIAHNTGDRDMPLGFGIHPYFRRPAQGTLLVPARKRWELADSLPTGKLVDVTGAYDLRQATDVTALELDDIYTDVIPDADGMVRCVLEDQQARTQTIVAFDPALFPHVVIYTAPAPRRAICIEPYTCPTDAFNLQEQGIESNVIMLPAGSSKRFDIAMTTRSMA